MTPEEIARLRELAKEHLNAFQPPTGFFGITTELARGVLALTGLMTPAYKWDYDAKPLLPGTRLHVEWGTHPPRMETFGTLLEVTHVAGDDTGQTILLTRQDARGLLKYLRRSGMVGQEMSPQVYSGSGLEDCKNCGAYPDCHDGFGRCPRGAFSCPPRMGGHE